MRNRPYDLSRFSKSIGIAKADEKVVSPPQNPIARFDEITRPLARTSECTVKPAIKAPTIFANMVSHGLVFARALIPVNSMRYRTIAPQAPAAAIAIIF